jgi:hypothetical protein
LKRKNHIVFLQFTIYICTRKSEGNKTLPETYLSIRADENVKRKLFGEKAAGRQGSVGYQPVQNARLNSRVGIHTGGVRLDVGRAKHMFF